MSQEGLAARTSVRGRAVSIAPKKVAAAKRCELEVQASEGEYTRAPLGARTHRRTTPRGALPRRPGRPLHLEREALWRY